MPEAVDAVAVMCQLPPLLGFPPEALEALAAQLQPVTYEAGEPLCRQGGACQRLVIIGAGQVDTPNLRAELRAGPGDVIGVDALFSDACCGYGLRATTLVRGWQLSREAFRAALAPFPQAQWLLLDNLARELRPDKSAVLHYRPAGSARVLRVALFDTKPYTEETFRERCPESVEVHYLEPRLTINTAAMASGFDVVVPFVNDHLDKAVITLLAENGVRLIAMRCAGYNNVDLHAAYRAGLTVVRVPAYSPHAVAEHAVALLLTLNRKTHRAYNRVREGNFALHGLVGWDLHGHTAGIIGVGKIGKCLVEILAGFGMQLLGHDMYPDQAFAARTGLRYTSLDEIFREADVISLHAPLLPSTHHLVNAQTLARMKRNVMLINTSRGALIDATALIDGLKSGQVGAAGLDVYEEEEEYFFEDRSGGVVTDDTLARLLTFPNVLITSHQAFLTSEALRNIADTTYANIAEFAAGKRLQELTHVVLPPSV